MAFNDEDFICYKKVTKASVPKLAVWECAPANKLIGMCATRIKPALYDNISDSSYIDQGVRIRKVYPAGDIEISCEHSHYKWVLDPVWNDNNWVRAPDDWCKNIKK
jgi:hypothetical protein